MISAVLLTESYVTAPPTSLHSSTSIKKRSNLDMIGADIAIFCLSALLLSYLPPIGLAAAKIEVLAFRVALEK